MGIVLSVVGLKNFIFVPARSLNGSIHLAINHIPIRIHNKSRIFNFAKNENKIKLNDKETDILIIGHGSMDALSLCVNNLKSLYRNVTHCFLEIEKPDIKQGISTAEKNSPKVLVIVFYFLHKGAHVKRDIYEDLDPALNESSIDKTVITKHIGADEMMADLICERAGEVEDAD